MDYRCYRATGEEGHFIDFASFEASSDPEALKIALQLKKDRNWQLIELWQGRRLISFSRDRH